jgi:hypothetical protein
MSFTFNIFRFISLVSQDAMHHQNLGACIGIHDCDYDIFKKQPTDFICRAMICQQQRIGQALYLYFHANVLYPNVQQKFHLRDVG